MVATSKRTLSVLAFLCALGAAACSSSGDTHGSTSSGTGGGGAGGATGGGPPGPTYPFGEILAESDAPDGLSRTGVIAGFYVAQTSGCTTTDAGTCELVDCSNAGKAKLASAGKLTVKGAGTSITVTPDAQLHYDYESTDQLWDTGSKLTFSAPGADVPAFSVSGTALAVPTLTTPVITIDQPHATIARDHDLGVAFSGVPKGSADLVLVSQPDGAVQLECVFDGAAGTGTVPASLLGKLAPGPDWVLLFRAADRETVSAGAWTVELHLVTTGQTSDGIGTNAQVELLK